MKKYKFLKSNIKQRGFSLVGVLVAAFIALLVLTALLSMLSQILALGRVSKNKFVAVNLAKEGIELVRNMRDSNWLYYPVVSGTSVQAMQWRGCQGGGTATDCVKLKSLCNGGPYTVDALDDDLILKSAPNLTDRELKQVTYGGAKVFTHQAGGTTNPIFSRSITIGSADIEPSELSEDYLPVLLGCGETADFSSTNSLKIKPRGIVVTSRVEWLEPGTGTPKNVELTGILYDWLTQRP
ncbi:MAG: prepilin-type N-terminal cleavage/methylation domain-containing protein [bacterium]|nr:prepilin-type N-terminal cleavage/methylation domain-containing protein [bacterium]